MAYCISDRHIMSDRERASSSYYFDRNALWSAGVQDRLRGVAASAGRYEVTCLCRAGQPLPMLLRERKKDGGHFLARPPSTSESAHSANCRHAHGDVGGALGFERGVLTRNGEDLVLDVGSWLAINTPDSSGGGGGARAAEPLLTTVLGSGHCFGF